MKSVQIQMLLVVVTVVFSLCASAAEYAPVSYTQAKEIQLDPFPIETKPLSAARQAELGLRPLVLPTDGMFFDHQRGGKFAMKLLKAGTLVLVDKNGVPRYEEKCGNRIFDPKQFMPSPAVSQPAILPAMQPVEKSGLDSIRTWVSNLPEPAKMMVRDLSWLMAVGLLIAAVILAFWGLSALFGLARHNINERGWHRSAPPPMA